MRIEKNAVNRKVISGQSLCIEETGCVLYIVNVYWGSVVQVRCLMGMRLLEKKRAGLDSRKTWSDIVSLVESNVREYMAILHVNRSSKVLHWLVWLVCLLERE